MEIILSFDQALAAVHLLRGRPYIAHKDKAAVSFDELGSLLGHIRDQLPPLQGRRVLILLPDSVSCALLHLESFRQGATIVPVSPFVALSQLDHIVRRIRPHFVITTALLRAKFAAVLESCPVVELGTKSAIELLPPSGLSVTDTAPPSPVRAVLFTSGTTGIPKGVCLSEENLLSAARINCSIVGLSPCRRSVVTVPLYDYYGMIQLYAHLLAQASCSIGESGQFPKAAFKTMLRQDTTDLVLVPFTLAALLAFLEASGQPDELRSWERLACVATSSDRLEDRLLERAFSLNPNLTVVNVYGLTEAGRACFKTIKAGSRPGDSIGNASPSMKVWVDAPRGTSGEIVITGPTVMLGYLTDVVDDVIQFAPATEIRTADEAYIGDDGEIHLLGRTDHLLNLHGEKLHPAEIEAPVNQLPGVMSALARLSGGHQDRPVVELDVVSSDPAITPATILGVLRDRVPRIFLPETIRFVDALERTEIGGKLVRPRPGVKS